MSYVVCMLQMYMDRPHVRFDGIYVSRNTYIRTGIPEWKVKNPVHLVCYFRYIRFLKDGTFYYRTSPHVLRQVARTLRNPSKNDLHSSSDSRVFLGKYKMQENGTVLAAFRYSNSNSTEIRSKLKLRSTRRGAFNRMDIQYIVSFDREDGRSIPMMSEEHVEWEASGDDASRREYRRGTEPYVFVDWENVSTSILNLPVSEMDVFIAG